MKVLRQDRNTVCFIEFEVSSYGFSLLINIVRQYLCFPITCLKAFSFFQDVNAATSVHQTLQGAVIPSSGRGGMRIQYPLSIEKMLDS
jgi:hypothetical protein